MAVHRGITVPSGTDNANVPQTITTLVDSMFPVGMIMMYGGTTAPPGWLLCDGAMIPSGGAYAALRGLVGVATPDMTGRVPVGPSGGGALFTASGASSVTLSLANLPSHSHDMSHGHGTAISSGISNGHAHAFPGNNPIPILDGTTGNGGLVVSTAGGRAYFTGPQSDDHTHNVPIPGFSGTTTSVGSGTAVSVMQPSRSVNFIIKY